MSSYKLNSNIYLDTPDAEPTRAGFGRGLKAAGEANPNVVGLCADLVESVQMHLFAEHSQIAISKLGLPSKIYRSSRAAWRERVKFHLRRATQRLAQAVTGSRLKPQQRSTSNQLKWLVLMRA